MTLRIASFASSPSSPTTPFWQTPESAHVKHEALGLRVDQYFSGTLWFQLPQEADELSDQARQSIRKVFFGENTRAELELHLSPRPIPQSRRLLCIDGADIRFQSGVFLPIGGRVVYCPLYQVNEPGEPFHYNFMDGPTGFRD